MIQEENIYPKNPISDTDACEFKIAELPEGCQAKIHAFEQELNKQGFWNIALVAYQKLNPNTPL